MGLYERLLKEAQEKEKEKENPEWEEQRNTRARKRQRMQAYTSSRRRSLATSGGYVTSQVVQQDQQRHLADLQALEGLVNGGVRSVGASYRLAWLRRKYPVEYAHLRDIEISNSKQGLPVPHELYSGHVFFCDLHACY